MYLAVHGRFLVLLVTHTMKPKETAQEARATMINRYVRVCSDMYHFGIAEDVNQRIEILLNSGNAAKDAISFLKLQYRRAEVIDSWSPLEMALFTAGVARFGRDWQSLKSILPHKSALEMSKYYYSVWKGSNVGEASRKLRKQRGLDIG